MPLVSWTRKALRRCFLIYMSEAPVITAASRFRMMSELSVAVGGEERPMCCHGCQAVAQSIVANGLEDYYRSRDCVYRKAPREGDTGHPRATGAVRSHRIPRKKLRQTLGKASAKRSRSSGNNLCRLHLAQRTACRQVAGSYRRWTSTISTRRAQVRWDESRGSGCVDILGTIAAIGYRLSPRRHRRTREISRKGNATRLAPLGAGFRHDAGDDVRLSDVHRRR